MNTAIKQDQQYYLDKLPAEATRVAVLKDGKKRWVELSKLRSTDFLIIDPKTQAPHHMTGKPGRQPVQRTRINPLAQSLKKEKDKSVKGDSILLALQDNPNSEDVVYLIMQGMAEEIACLRHERERADLEGGKSVAISERRIKSLKLIGETWLKRMEQIQNREIDLNSTTFRLLFEFIMQTFRESMTKAGIKKELEDVVFTNIAKRLNGGWEAEARSIMRKN